MNFLSMIEVVPAETVGTAVVLVVVVVGAASDMLVLSSAVIVIRTPRRFT